MIEGVQEVRCYSSDDRNTYCFRKVLFQFDVHGTVRR